MTTTTTEPTKADPLAPYICATTDGGGVYWYYPASREYLFTSQEGKVMHSWKAPKRVASVLPAALRSPARRRRRASSSKAKAA